MKVYELMDRLSEMSAGDDVLLSAHGTPAELLANPGEGDEDHVITLDFAVEDVDGDMAIIYIGRVKG